MDKSLTMDNIKYDPQLIKECNAFYSSIESLKSFGNYCNLNSFVYLFGNNEGERLWHFL